MGPDDGLDPRVFFQKSSRKKTNRKALQLAGQVAETLNWVLGWESSNEILRSMSVESVVPAPDSTRMLVTVRFAGGALGEAQEHLHRAAGKLRSEVAASIHRKRVPELIFRVIPEVTS
jgi:ribosome-binding factor A